MTTTNFTTIILKPEPGNFITNANNVDIRDRIIATTIALGKNDVAENYIEISAEKAEEYKRLQDEAREADRQKALEAKHD